MLTSVDWHCTQSTSQDDGNVFNVIPVLDDIFGPKLWTKTKFSLKKKKVFYVSEFPACPAKFRPLWT